MYRRINIYIATILVDLLKEGIKKYAYSEQYVCFMCEEPYYLIFDIYRLQLWKKSSDLKSIQKSYNVLVCSKK